MPSGGPRRKRSVGKKWAGEGEDWLGWRPTPSAAEPRRSPPSPLRASPFIPSFARETVPAVSPSVPDDATCGMGQRRGPRRACTLRACNSGAPVITDKNTKSPGRFCFCCAFATWPRREGHARSALQMTGTRGHPPCRRLLCQQAGPRASRAGLGSLPIPSHPPGPSPSSAGAQGLLLAQLLGPGGA